MLKTGTVLGWEAPDPALCPTVVPTVSVFSTWFSKGTYLRFGGAVRLGGGWCCRWVQSGIRCCSAQNRTGLLRQTSSCGFLEVVLKK